jgi:hypothetical protein
MAIIDRKQKQRSATVRAVVDSRVVAIDEDEFSAWCIGCNSSSANAANCRSSYPFWRRNPPENGEDVRQKEGRGAGNSFAYKYLTSGSPLSRTAPDAPDDYEIRYVSERVPDLIFEATPLVVG